MGMYAIKDTTLTALGDAVRSKLNKNSDKYENIKLIGASLHETISLEITAPQYKCILDNAEISKVSSSDIRFEIYEEDILSNRLYYAYSLKNEDFPIEIISSNPKICFYYRASGEDSLSFDLTIIPLDENGEEYKYTPLEMADAINGLNILPEEALNITGECDYRFSYDSWNWFINTYGSQIKTKDITSAKYMFAYSPNLSNIPFTLNFNECLGFSNLFSGYQGTQLPKIVSNITKLPTSAYTNTVEITYLFSSCNNIKELPDDIFYQLIPNQEYWDLIKQYNTPKYGNIFNNCSSLRKLPDISMLRWSGNNSSNVYSGLTGLYTLDEIVDLPVCGEATSNRLSGCCSYMCRLQRFTFETAEDGSPIDIKWGKHTLDLTNYTGYTSTSTYITGNGITADKEVKDDATYQALKNDPDWWSANINYSRYNHDSAVETINSLPDCSATGTNTIKFKGASGSLTDGGAINTLTEEEIAVATAKGWTVSFV